MNCYALVMFNPELAYDIDYTGDGIMFSYNDPVLIEQAIESNGEAPTDFVISLSDSSIALHPVYMEDEEAEECFFAVDTCAGLQIVEWAAENAYNLTGKERREYVRRVFSALACEPSESGQVYLNAFNAEQRKAVYMAYEASKTTVNA